MAGWASAGRNRWVWDGDDRHLLFKAGTRFVEYHLGTVHVYDSALEPDPDRVVTEGLLDGAPHVASFDRGELADADVPALWQAMTSADHLKSAP